MAGDLRAIRRALVTAAKDRTIQDTGRERVGRPVADLPGPLALGVRAAVSAGDTRLPVLPEYVPRDHDAQLQAIMEAADQASRMIVLAGDSSTGKTRALWEALRHLPDHWRVWSPAGARALNKGLAAAGVGPRTVVWLDDAHNYLGLASQLAADTAERLIGLIADPDGGPVLIAATLWPQYWQQLTAQPRRAPGQTEFASAEQGLARIPALLESATYLHVPSAFATDDLAQQPVTQPVMTLVSPLLSNTLPRERSPSIWPVRRNCSSATGPRRRGQGPRRRRGRRSSFRAHRPVAGAPAPRCCSRLRRL